MRREGKGLYQAEVIVTLWKELNIPGSVLWYLAGQIPADDIYWFPSDNELYMLRKGYHEYDGPIYESPFSAGWDGLGGVFYGQ